MNLPSSSNNETIFNALGLQREYTNIQHLFNIRKHDKIIKGECVSRMTFILNIYSKWIELQQQQEPSKPVSTLRSDRFINMTMYDILANELHPNYSVQLFLTDYRYVVDGKRNAFGYFDVDCIEQDETKDDLFCDAMKCKIKNRNGRPRPIRDRARNQGNEAMSRQRDEIFFIRNNGDNNDDDNSTKSVMIQEILDTLHCWVYHSLRLDINKYIDQSDADKDNDEDDAANDDAVDMLHDDLVVKLGEIIKKARESSRRFISDQRYDAINNKYITTNANEESAGNRSQQGNIEGSEENDITDAVATYQSIIYGNDQLQKSKEKQKRAGSKISDAITWTDDLLQTLSRYCIDPSIVDQMIRYLIDENYGTESIEDDIKAGDDKSSNIIHLFGASGDESLSKLFDVFLIEQKLNRRVYSPGWRYYYWDHYKHNSREYEVLYSNSTGRPILDENKGYRLMDWFIEVKYLTFKEEILNNQPSPFGLAEFMDTYESAKAKRQNIQHIGRFTAIRPKGNFYERCYGISPGTIITVDHILSILLYTNFTKHSYLFSTSYRKNGLYESDEAIKARHAEHYWWGKNLRESVEIYGETMAKRKDIAAFYHGISDTLLFNSTTINLYGPVSTTADFIVAWSIFGSGGVVLDIQNRCSSSKLFNMNFFSCFTGEDEKLFLANNSPLSFTNIHHIPMKTHYKNSIKLITMSSKITTGYVLEGVGTPTARDAKALSRLMNSELEKEYRSSPHSSIYEVPQYISHTYHQFIKNKTHIQINIRYMDMDFILHNHRKNMDLYGYKKFKPIFIDGTTFKFNFVLRLMYNLQEMQIYYLQTAKQGFKASISLDDNFVEEMIKSIKFANETIGCIFNRWIIIEPKGSIKQFIIKYQARFNKLKWELTQTEFTNKERAITSNNVLFICRL